VIEDFDHCYRALSAKDPRFDGWLFTAVTSTGVYCRPSCPATVPRREHVRFYASAAACQHAGFRACKRCRPDASPGSPEWNTRGDVVARAMRLIADGAIDRGGVPALASQLGYSPRQLERVLLAEVGATPLALARAQRTQTARILIETSSLSMAEVAMAAGFRSIRQFNDTVRQVFSLTPTELRRRLARTDAKVAGAGMAGAGVAGNSLRLRLAFRGRLSPGNLFGHLAATAIPGVEEVREGTYRRTLRLPHGPGIVELTPRPDHVSCRATLADLRDLTAAIARCRWLLDLDADPEAVDSQLAQEPELRESIGRAPGRRVPRAVDGAEMAIRAVLGQQISTAAARTHGGRLAGEHGDPLDDPDGGLSRLFPAPEALVDAQLAMPAARQRTMRALLGALVSGELAVDPAADREATLAVLGGLPGIGPWTRDIISMRALGDPDVFPVGDLGVRRGAAALGLPSDARALSERSERWRPWRAYAVQYLWAATAHPINDWPPGGAVTAAGHGRPAERRRGDGPLGILASPDGPAATSSGGRRAQRGPHTRIAA
jgi:AraC family transcriptional regulator, regulatory protein of adaptative response / DNA-3-methyladenine glycosylase II